MNIKEDSLIEELKEEYFTRTGKRIEEFEYYTGSTEKKEKEPEYLEHDKLYFKLDYLNREIINNLGEHILRRKETPGIKEELNIYNCYADDHCWEKLNLARDIHKLTEQIDQPYPGLEIGIATANIRYADLIERLILNIKRARILEDITDEKNILK